MKLGAPFCFSLSSKAAGGRCLFDKVRKVVGRSAGRRWVVPPVGRPAFGVMFPNLCRVRIVGLALAPAAAHSLCNYDATRVLFICAVWRLPSISLLDQGLVDNIEQFGIDFVR
jgi:hypothetical protein